MTKLLSPRSLRFGSLDADDSLPPPLTPVKRPPSLQLVTELDVDPGEMCVRDSTAMRFFRIIIAPAVIFGCSFSMALQFVLLTPFATFLGVSEKAASLVWLMGPVTGLVVQPVIGQLSDLYHRQHATRLPIVTIASMVLVLSHLGIAFCMQIQNILKIPALVTLISSFWIFDASNNAITVTMRAMLSDRFGKEHRTFAFSMLQFWTSLGYIAGYFVSRIEPEKSNDLSERITMAFIISACMVMVGTILSFLSVFEKRACRMRFHTVHTGSKFNFATCLEPCLITILAGSVLTWFGWFSQQIYQTNFVGEKLLGDPSSAEAVQITAYGLVISSVLSCLTGLLVLPVSLAFMGYDSIILFRVWALSAFLQGLNLLASPLVETVPGAVLWEATTGPMYAVALTVPFMLVANGCDHGASGRVMALVNVAVCLPQLVVSLGGGIVISISNSDVGLFLIGGILCFIATYILWVPQGANVPTWATRSTASIVASTSDLFSTFEESESWLTRPLV